MIKIENSPFDPFVKWFFPKLLPYLPDWLTANRITGIGFAGSLLSAICLYFSQDYKWLCLLGTFGIWLHWFADTLDGIVARAGTPSILGYYLDHFSDAVSVAVISIGLFLTPGSHLLIGLCAACVYLLLFIHGLIKAELTGTMELPFFGPTEIHFSIIVILLIQYKFHYGEAIMQNSPITGINGWFANTFDFNSGLTLIDHLGIGITLVMLIMLLIESYSFMKQLSISNSAPPDA